MYNKMIDVFKGTDKFQKERIFFEDQRKLGTSLEEVIKMAVPAIDEDEDKKPNKDRKYKKYSHQSHLVNDILYEFSERLLEQSQICEIRKEKDFYQLLKFIKGFRIKGIGELAIYDTAARIGIFKNIYPKYVYMHAGSREGAINFFGENKFKDILKYEDCFTMIDKSHFPQEFQIRCFCAEIEAILCIYKNCFENENLKCSKCPIDKKSECKIYNP